MSNEVKLPRGIRNNNPLNIRLSSDKWQHIRATAKVTPQKQSSSSKNILGVYVNDYFT